VTQSSRIFGDLRHSQWLKYKFGSTGALKKFGTLLSAEGALRNLFIPHYACVGPGNYARQQF